MKWAFLIIGFCLIFLGLLMFRKEDPFFKKRNFKYYKDGELVAWEYRSYAEPAHQIERLGFIFPEYDEVRVEKEI